jgi:sulfur-oxidizing protein SoxY
MTEQVQIRMVGRRDVVVGASAAGVLVALIGTSRVVAQERLPTFEEVMKKILGDAKPTEAKIMIDMPEIAENGNTVPFTVAVESPMSEKDYVKTVHVLANGNPQANVGAFNFTPLSGKASLQSRMRLAKTQDVYAIAELSDGKFLMSKRTVKVTIGGCGG